MTARQGELLEKPKRKMRGQLMHVCDVGGNGDTFGVVVRLQCIKCSYMSEFFQFDTVTEARRGLPCPKCNNLPDGWEKEA